MYGAMMTEFVWWDLMFVDYPCGTFSGTWNFDLASRFLDNLCTPALCIPVIYCDLHVLEHTFSVQ